MIKYAFSKISSFLVSESGASAAEYTLILAIIGVGIAAAAGILGVEISNAIKAAANCIANKACS